MENSEEIVIPRNRHERPAVDTLHRRGRKFVRFADLRPEYGITWSRMHIDREEKAGRFPARVQFGRRAVGWLEDELIEWQNEQIAARKQHPDPEQPEPPLAA